LLLNVPLLLTRAGFVAPSFVVEDSYA
jgi:hypothetical protein